MAISQSPSPPSLFLRFSQYSEVRLFLPDYKTPFDRYLESGKLAKVIFFSYSILQTDWSKVKQVCAPAIW